MKEHSHPRYKDELNIMEHRFSFCSMAQTKHTAHKTTEPKQGTLARFAIPTTGAYSKGRKLPDWMKN